MISAAGTDIPEARFIDYTDVDEICGYQQLLCRKFEQMGGFAYPYRPTPALRQLQTQGHVWLKRVRTVIDGIIDGAYPGPLTLGAVPRMLSAYDFLHRICNGRPAPAGYTRNIRLRSLDLWLRGDESLTETDAVIGILLETERDCISLDDRYTAYAFAVMDKWIASLNATGQFLGIPLAEAYARLTYLLRSDLFAHFGAAAQPAVKARWVRANILPDTRIDQLTPSELTSYISFTQTLAYLSSQTPAEQDELYVRLHTLLASNASLHPYYRQSIQIDLAKYPAA